MIPDDPFESIDRALSSGLSALAPNVAGDDETLAALRPRFRRARTRRRVAQAGGVLSSLLLVGGVAALAAPESAHTHVSVSSPSTTPNTNKRPHRSAPPSSTSTVPRTVPTTTTPTSVLTPTTARPNRGVGPGSSSGPGSSVTFPAPVVTTVPSQGPTTGGGHSPGGPPATTPTTRPPTIYGGVAGTHGGTITYNFANGRLRLLDVSPANGYYKDVFRDSYREIDVRFWRGGELRYRIDLQVKDGHLVRNDTLPH